MPYRVQIMPSALRALNSLDRTTKRHISAAIDTLAEEPRPHGAVKVQAREEAWRLRVGDYRVVYTIEDRQVTVSVIAIGHRRDIYRRH